MPPNFSCLLLFCWFVVVLLTLSYFSSVADEESTIEEQENMEGEADHKAELVDLTKDGIFLIPQKLQFQCKTCLACVHRSLADILLLVTVCLGAFSPTKSDVTSKKFTKIQNPPPLLSPQTVKLTLNITGNIHIQTLIANTQT